MMHKVPRDINQKVFKAQLPFLHSARHLMLIDICIKFREFSFWFSSYRADTIFVMHKVQRETTQKV